MTLSITKAIIKATEGDYSAYMEKVSSSPFQYVIRRYDEKANSYRASQVMNYHQARSYLTQTHHADALIALGWNNHDADCEAHKNWIGSLRHRVTTSVNSSPF